MGRKNDLVDYKVHMQKMQVFIECFGLIIPAKYGRVQTFVSLSVRNLNSASLQILFVCLRCNHENIK